MGRDKKPLTKISNSEGGGGGGDISNLGAMAMSSVV